MNIDYLNEIRLQEIKSILSKHHYIFYRKKVLEIGGGTGVQASELKKVSTEVISLEVEDTNYHDHVPAYVKYYDGHHIPFPDNHFDVVYSSNVLEHVAHRDEFQKEIMRVLKPGGYALHTMPTHWWRLREMIQNIMLFFPRLVLYISKLILGKSIPRLVLLEHMFGARHGEFGGIFTELYYFMPRTWAKHFKKAGWDIITIYPGGLFYTGRLIFGPKLSWRSRRLLARLYGSSCYVYFLRRR